MIQRLPLGYILWCCAALVTMFILAVGNNPTSGAWFSDNAAGTVTVHIGASPTPSPESSDNTDGKNTEVKIDPKPPKSAPGSNPSRATPEPTEYPTSAQTPEPDPTTSKPEVPPTSEPTVEPDTTTGGPKEDPTVGMPDNNAPSNTGTTVTIGIDTKE